MADGGDVQAVLIVATAGLYALAFAAMVARARRLGDAAFAAAFVAASAGWIWRWVDVGHVPLQNLFEVFLTMGVLVAPLAVLCDRAFRVPRGAWDALIACAVLFPLVGGILLPEHFGTFSAAPRRLPPALQSPLFVPHVAVYLLAYVAMAKASLFAGARLIAEREGGEAAVAERAMHRMVCLGFPLLTAGLLLGATWGKLAWGDYWNWDPKELWSLVAWLVFLGYFHWRAMFGRRRGGAAAAIVLAGMLAIIATLVLPSLMAGLHSYAM
jgi:ABC-type transport system involved in cytochrome c biogenesis permease subunit